MLWKVRIPIYVALTVMTSIVIDALIAQQNDASMILKKAFSDDVREQDAVRAKYFAYGFFALLFSGLLLLLDWLVLVRTLGIGVSKELGSDPAEDDITKNP